MPSRTQAPSKQDAGMRQSSTGSAPVASPQEPLSSTVVRRGPDRTLWERGHHPGRLVVRATTVGLTVVTLISLLFGNHIGTVFGVAFVLLCLTAALWVRPRDFFTVGVLPPLLLGAVVLVLALADRPAVAHASDPLFQAVVSGLAHHAFALVVGYGLTLLVLALRQIALRNGGALRPHRGNAG